MTTTPHLPPLHIHAGPTCTCPRIAGCNAVDSRHVNRDCPQHGPADHAQTMHHANPACLPIAGQRPDRLGDRSIARAAIHAAATQAWGEPDHGGQAILDHYADAVVDALGAPYDAGDAAPSAAYPVRPCTDALCRDVERDRDQIRAELERVTAQRDRLRITNRALDRAAHHWAERVDDLHQQYTALEAELATMRQVAAALGEDEQGTACDHPTGRGSRIRRLLGRGGAR